MTFNFPHVSINEETVDQDSKLETLPEYKYGDHIPSFLKYKKGTVFDTLYTLEDNISRGLSLAITGTESCGNKKLNDMKFGERTFITSGICSSDSIDNCAGQPRNIIVDNIPSGNFKKPTDYRVGKQPKIGPNAGLIPSIIEDVLTFRPDDVISSFAGNSNIVKNKCQRINFEEKQIFPKKKPKTLIHNICVPYNPNIIKETFIIKKNINYKFYLLFFIFILLIYFIIKNMK